MAIQTHGFGVDVAPGIGLADPNLVAFNPNQLSQGVLHAYALAGAHYNLQETKAKIHAQKKLQDELDALREDRIGAKKAQYGADASTANRSVAQDSAAAPNIIPAARYEGDKIAALSQLLGPQTQAGLGAANKSVNDLKFGESQRGILEQVQGIGNETALKTAPTEALARIKLADNSLDKASLDYRKIADAAQFFDADASQERAKTAASIDLAKAQTAKDTATANDIADRARREQAKLDSAEYRAQLAAEAKQTQIINDVKAFDAVAAHANATALKHDNLQIIDPSNPNGPKITLGEAIRKFYDEDPATGKITPKGDGWFSKNKLSGPVKEMIDARQKAIETANRAALNSARIQEKYLNERYPNGIDSGSTQKSFNSADDVKAAVKAGQLSKEEAKGILVKQFNFSP